MQITFLIGNGFDLRVGMKTRFVDMYEEYVKAPSETAQIAWFKHMLKEDAPKYATWGDFEMAMAQIAHEFESEDTFIKCLRDFKSHMVSHLKKEQKRFENRQKISPQANSLCQKETMRSIHEFYIGLKPNVVNELIRLGITVKPDPVYRFISFNYTNAFDNLLDPLEGSVLHIHGKLGSDIVLGVDNPEQIVPTTYKITKKLIRAFIKPEFNKSYDNDRLDRAKDIIDESDIICIYGLSLGYSDLLWSERIKRWLLSSPRNHVVYFMYDKRVFDLSNWDEIMEEEEERIFKFLEKIHCSTEEKEKVFDQIHVPVCYDIFAIDDILKEETRKVIDENAKKEEILRRLKESDSKSAG